MLRAAFFTTGHDVQTVPGPLGPKRRCRLRAWAIWPQSCRTGHMSLSEARRRTKFVVLALLVSGAAFGQPPGLLSEYLSQNLNGRASRELSAASTRPCWIGRHLWSS